MRYRFAFVTSVLLPVLAAAPSQLCAQGIDSLSRLTALEDSLSARPNDPRAPQWLWEAGSIWRRVLPGYACEALRPLPPLAARYPQYFRRHCCSCESFYVLFHFQELVRRFPDSPLAPDAAYLLTRAPTTGECEGSIACRIEREYGSLESFLRAYPTSAHVSEAVQRANAAFIAALSFRPRPGMLYRVDSAAIRSLIARYDTTAGGLPPSQRMAAFQALSPMWSAFHNEPRATALRAAVLGSLPPDDASAYRRQWDSLVTVLTAPVPPRR
jgi:hypothetical protein